MTSAVFGSGPHTWVFPPILQGRSSFPTETGTRRVTSHTEVHHRSPESQQQRRKKREANICFLASLNYPWASCVYQVKKTPHNILGGSDQTFSVKTEPFYSNLSNVTKVCTKID